MNVPSLGALGLGWRQGMLHGWLNCWRISESQFRTICGDDLSYFEGIVRQLGHFDCRKFLSTIRSRTSCKTHSRRKTLQNHCRIAKKNFLFDFKIAKKNIFTTDRRRLRAPKKNKVLNKHCQFMSCEDMWYDSGSNFDRHCVKSKE